MGRFSSYPLLTDPQLDPDDLLVFSAGSNTFAITARNVLGAITSITTATAAQELGSDTVFTKLGMPRIGPFEDIALFATGLRQLPLNQFRWGLYAVYGDTNFSINGMIGMSGSSPSSNVPANSQRVPYISFSPLTTNSLSHRSFDSGYFNFGVPAYTRTKCRVAQTDNCRWTFGFAQTLTSGDPTSTTRYAFLWYKSSESANVQLLCVDGTTVERVDTGIPMDTDYHIWEVAYADGEVLAFRDGEHIATNSTSVPLDGNVHATCGIMAMEAVCKVMDMEYFMAVTRR